MRASHMPTLILFYLILLLGSKLMIKNGISNNLCCSHEVHEPLLKLTGDQNGELSHLFCIRNGGSPVALL